MLPKMKKGDQFTMTGYSKLEGMETPGTWKIERLGRVDGEPTYIMRSDMPEWDDDELIQHYAADIDELLEDGERGNPDDPHFKTLERKYEKILTAIHEIDSADVDVFLDGLQTVMANSYDLNIVYDKDYDVIGAYNDDLYGLRESIESEEHEVQQLIDDGTAYDEDGDTPDDAQEVMEQAIGNIETFANENLRPTYSTRQPGFRLARP